MVCAASPSSINTTTNQLTGGRADLQPPITPTGGAPTNLPRLLQHVHRNRPHLLAPMGVVWRYQGGFEHRPAGKLGRAALLCRDFANAEYNHPRRHREQKRGLRGPWGWTLLAATPGQRHEPPAVATWTKPGTIPYLNLFCDPEPVPMQLPDRLELCREL